MELMTSPHLPPEVLQMVFRNLEFFDLIRCKRVCKTWAAYLPSNDPELRRLPFLRDDVKTKKHFPEALPMITIKVKAPIEAHSVEKGTLPGLVFSPDFEFRRIRLYADGTTLHPMVVGLEGFMHLMNPNISICGSFSQRSTVKHYTHGPGHIFIFKSLKELKRKTCLPKDHQYNDGSWKNMMLCEPAVERIEVRFDWSTYRRRLWLKLDGLGKGVTVGQFASGIRSFLAGAEQDVKSFASAMGARCENHGDFTYTGEETDSSSEEEN